MYDEWKWWAGDNDEDFRVGPMDSREDAIQEALDQCVYDEVQSPNGNWSRVVYVMEARGTFYDCDECGTVERACDECQDYGDSPHWFFKQTRNAAVTYHPYETAE